MATTVGADREKKRNQEEFWRIVGRGNRPIRGDRCSAVTLDGDATIQAQCCCSTSDAGR